MKRVRLSRGQLRDLQSDTSEVAESIAAAEYDYNSFLTASWYDARRKDTGAVLEVKATLRNIGDKYPASGRFRLFKGQHDRLVRYDRSESAAYAFVLMEPENARAKLVKKNPADVGRIVGARGGWGPSGHSSQGKQKKLPIDALFS